MENARTLELNNILTQQVFRKFVVPSILALIASNISSTIDTIIIGNSLGETGLAAMSLVSPIYLIYFSIGSMIAVGSSIVTGIALGKKDNEQAQRLYFTTFFLALCVGILMTLLGLLSIDGIMGVLGAKGHLLPHVRSYCFYYICGGTFTVLFYVPFNFVRIFGRPKWSMYLLIIVGTCNIVLTLIFVNIFHMGT